MTRLTPFLTVSNLSKSYPDRRTESAAVAALDHVSFEILQGECLALVGESGSGKTTLGQIVLRLVRPDTGTLTYQERNLFDLSDREFRKLRPRFQVVFQNHSQVFDPRQSIGAALAEPLQVHCQLTKTEVADRVKMLMSQVGLSTDLRARLPHELSGGQRQRVAIARALTTSPEFLIADEPTSNLDAALKRDIMDLLRSLQRDLGLTLLLITHDLGVVSHIADRIAVIHRGRIVETADAQKLIAAPIHPYTRQLIECARLSWRPGQQPARPAGVTEATSSRCHFVENCPWETSLCHEARPALAVRTTGHKVACHHVQEITQTVEPIPVVPA